MGVAGLLGLSLLSCGREITGPGDGLAGARRTAAFALAPKFIGPAEGADLVSDLVPFELVRVVLRRLDGSVAKDTLVPFPSNAETISLTLVVPIPQNSRSPNLEFSLTMKYINAAGDTVFSGGPIAVQGVVTGSGPPTAVEIPVTYSGTGAAATSVVVSPDTGTVLAGATTQFSAIARDQANAVIPNTPVLFTTPDPSRVTVTAAGLATWLPVRGPARVIGTLLTNQAADTVTLNVTLPPTQLLLVSGGGQTATIGQALTDSLVLRVAASDSVGVSGREVTFAVTAGGGALTTTVDTSDANGLVSTKWTLGSLVGAQSVTATATGIAGATRIITATGTTPVPVRTVFTSAPVSVVAGATVPPVTVEVRDALGAVTPLFTGPVTVSLDAGATGATLGGTTTVNAVAGVATFSTLAITKAASGLRLVASGAGLAPDTSAAFVVTPAAATALTFVAGAGQTGTVAQPLADSVAALVTDAFANPVPGLTVNFSVTNGGGSVSPASGVTGADGIARTRWTLGPTVTLQEVRAELNGFPLIFQQMTATAVAGTVSALSVVTQPVGGIVGALLGSVAVEATDNLGNRILSFTGNVTVAIDSGPAGATLTGAGTVAAVAGVATYSGLSVDVAGTYRLRFTAAGLTTATSAPFSASTSVIQWINGAGGNWSTTSNWDLGRLPTAADSVVIGASGTYTVTMDVNPTVGSIRVGGASGTQTLLANSATIAAPNGVVVAVAGVLSIASTTISGSVTNAGSFTVAGTGNTVGGLVTNTASGTLTIAPTNPVPSDAALTATAGLTNAGLVELSTQNGNCPSCYGAALTVSGAPLVNAVGGTLRTAVGTYPSARTITATLDNQGTLTANSPVALALSGSTQSTGLIDITSGPVTATQAGGASFLQAGTITVAAGQTFTLSGGAVTLDATSVLDGAGTVALTGTAVTLTTGQIRTAGTLTLNTASVTGTGALTNPVGGTLGFTGGVTTTVPVTNAGSFTVAGTGNTVGGLVTNTASGTLTIAPTNPVPSDADLTATAGLTNAGLVELSTQNGNCPSCYGAALTVTGASLVNAVGGTVRATVGTYPSARTITATLDNQGTLDLYPGTTGTLALSGSLTNSGNLAVDIGPGGSVDLLAITGGITLGGTLDAALVGGYVPPNGSSFTFLTHTAARSGTFGTVNVPTELSATPTYLANSITLNAAAGAGVRLGAGTPPVNVQAGDTAPTHSVTVRDAGGTVITSASGSVTVSVDSGPAGGTILGTTTATIVSGEASFTDHQFTVAGDYRLRYTSAGLADTVSTIFTVAPAAPDSLVILAGNGQSVTAFQVAPDSLRVRLQDAFGNAIPGAAVNFIVTAGDPTADPVTVLTNASGVAAAELTMGETVGAYTVDATSSGVPNAIFTGSTLPTMANMVWTGSVSSDFTDPANWLSNTAPISADSLLIPAGRPNYPVLTSNAQVAWATIDSGATVNVANSFLGLARGLDAPTTASILADTGGIIINGPTGAVRGRMPKLYVANGTFINDGALIVDSVLMVTDNAIISFGTLPVTIGLDLITTNAGKIAMGVGSSVTVGRNALFDGGNTTSLLTGGTLSVTGNFTTTASGDAAAFAAGPAHVVELIGTTSQTVDLAFPDATPLAVCSTSCFGTLRSLRGAGQGVVNFASDAKAVTALEITGDGVNAPGRTLISGGTPNLTATTVVAAKVGWQTGLLRSGSFTVDTLIAWGNSANMIVGETIPTRVSSGLMLLSGSHPAPIVIDGFGGVLDIVGTADVGTGSGDALITSGDGGLNMTDAADSLRVNGNARFGGSTVANALTAGVIELTGDFTQETGSLTFAAGAGHRLRLLGTAPTLSVATSVLNTIGTLDLQATASVTLDGPRILGDVIVGPSVSVVGGTATTVEIGGSLLEPIGGRWQMPDTRFTGPDPSLPASINGSVTFAAGATLDTALTIAGDLTVAGDTLDLNGNRVDVSGIFSINGVTAALRMASPADTLLVTGDVLFAGASTDGLLTDGVLDVLGTSFTASGDPASFAASGAHVTRFGAENNQTVSFSSPGLGANTQHFANLVIAQAGLGTEVQLLSDAVVNGTVASEPGNSGEFASTPGRILTARGADLVNVAFQGVALDLIDGAAIVALDSLTFYDQDPAAVQLSIARPSGAFTLSNPIFSTVPSTGRYLRVEDTNAGTDLSLTVSDPTPAGHGGFLETLGGATVTGWPAAVATQLVLTTPAAGAVSGAAFTTQPVIEVRDGGGALVATDNSTLVTLTASAGATVIGTASVTAVGGVATFTDVGLTGAANLYDLTFTAAGLDSATQQITLAGPPAPVIVWTGSVNNNWGTAGNWDLVRLPLPTDSVIINVTDTVNVSTATQVAWLNVGESSSPLFTIGSGATLTIDSLAFFGTSTTVTMTGGTLTGDGSVTILGALNWSGGTMTGSGITLIASLATATITGGPTLNTRSFSVGGTATLGGTAFNGSNVVGQTPTLAVLPGGTLEFTSTTSYFSGNGVVELVNNGTVRKAASAGLVRVDWPITNAGTLEIVDDSLDLRNALTHVSGTIDILANAALVNGGNTDAFAPITIAAGGVLTLQSGGISADAGNHIFASGSSVTGLGKLRINSADTTRIQGALDIDSLTVQNGNTWFEGPDTMFVTSGAYLGGGFFRGSGVLGIRGNFVLNSGNIVGTGGTMSVRPGGNLTLRGMSGWHVDVEGTATWGDYDMTFTHDTLNGVPYASLRVRSGGLLDVQHGTTTPRELFALGSATPPHVLFTIDAGATVRKSSGNGISNFRPRFVMAGVFDVLSGTINIQGTCAMSGSFTGSGSVSGNCGAYP